MLTWLRNRLRRKKLQLRVRHWRGAWFAQIWMPAHHHHGRLIGWDWRNVYPPESNGSFISERAAVSYGRTRVSELQSQIEALFAMHFSDGWTVIPDDGGLPASHPVRLSDDPDGENLHNTDRRLH